MTDIFFGTSGPRDARIALVGEAWGINEHNARAPFVGASGEILTGMLSDAGINRADVFLTNVIPALPPRNRLGKPEMYMFFEETRHARKVGQTPIRGLYPSDSVRRSLQILHQQLETVRPAVIVALGNYALWALVDHPHLGTANEEGRKIPTGITVWRGSQHLKWNTGPCENIAHTPIIPTFNPAAIMNQWSYRSAAVHDLRKRLTPAAPPQYNFIVRPSYAQVIEVLNTISHLPSGTWLSRDYETAAGHADCLGIAWSEREAICIPFIDLSTAQSYWSIKEELAIRESISALYSRHDYRWSGQNANYEAQYEAEWFDSTTDFVHDTMIAHHVLWPGTPMDLTYLSSLYCQYHRYWGEASWWEKSGDISERWRYNCEDAARTWEITQVLEELVDSMGFRSQFAERMEVARANLDIMLRGVKIDMTERRRQGLAVFMAMQKMEGEFQSLMPKWVIPLVKGPSGRAPWYQSPTQQMRFFYDLADQPEHRDKKTRARTVDDDTLQKIALREPLLADLCARLLEYRSAGMYYNNFLTAEVDGDNRLRCSIGEGPISFRMRSGKNAFGRGTNLQNIPKGKDE